MSIELKKIKNKKEEKKTLNGAETSVIYIL